MGEIHWLEPRSYKPIDLPDALIDYGEPPVGIAVAHWLASVIADRRFIAGFYAGTMFVCAAAFVVAFR